MKRFTSLSVSLSLSLSSFFPYIPFAVCGNCIYLYDIYFFKENNKYLELKNQNHKSFGSENDIDTRSIFKDSFYYDSIIVKLCKKII